MSVLLKFHLICSYAKILWTNFSSEVIFYEHDETCWHLLEGKVKNDGKFQSSVIFSSFINLMSTRILKCNAVFDEKSKTASSSLHVKYSKRLNFTRMHIISLFSMMQLWCYWVAFYDLHKVHGRDVHHVCSQWHKMMFDIYHVLTIHSCILKRWYVQYSDMSGDSMVSQNDPFLPKWTSINMLHICIRVGVYVCMCSTL